MTIHSNVVSYSYVSLPDLKFGPFLKLLACFKMGQPILKLHGQPDLVYVNFV